MVVLAFPTFDMWFLTWIAQVPTLWAARGTTARQHFKIGLWAGSVTNLGGFYWAAGMLMDFGHMSIWPAAALTVLLAVYQGLVFAVWLWLLARLRRWSLFGCWLLSPVAFVTCEFVIWFIFPWYYANSQYAWAPMIQVCELGGVTLLTFLLAMTNGAVFDALEAWRRGERTKLLRAVVVAVAVPAANAGYGLVRMAAIDAQAERAPKLNIGVVEADVGIWEKEDPEKYADNLVRHQRMSIELQRRGADLIVWPETAYHARFTVVRTKGSQQLRRYRFIPRDAAFIAQSESEPPEHAIDDVRAGTPVVDRVAPQRGFTTPLLFGALTFRQNPDNRSPRHPGMDVLNSAILVDDKGKVLGIFDKVYLLVFGEYIPLGHTFPVFHRWLPEAGDLTPGDGVKKLTFRGYRIGVMICYEDIIPAFIRKVAAFEPHVLINVTNDAWFGKTSEPYLHMALAVFRAVESRVPLIRATNTGISCFVDPAGRIIAQTRMYDAETLLQEVPMMDGGTPYQVLGDWPAWLCLLATPAFYLFSRRRRKR